MYTPIINPQYHSGAATALAFALLSYPLGARAIDLGFGDFQAHGFLSQGYTYTSGNDFFGNSQGAGSLEFHELGMNVLGHPFPNLLLAVQGIYRDTAGSDEEDFRLDYANLDYSLPIGESSTLGVRAGRVKNPFGLYSEARDAIWTRPSVLLPQSIYFDSLGLRSPELVLGWGYPLWPFQLRRPRLHCRTLGLESEPRHRRRVSCRAGSDGLPERAGVFARPRGLRVAGRPVPPAVHGRGLRPRLRARFARSLARKRQDFCAARVRAGQPGGMELYRRVSSDQLRPDRYLPGSPARPHGPRVLGEQHLRELLPPGPVPLRAGLVGARALRRLVCQCRRS